MAGLLHDIGKIGIPESILKKAGELTNEEYEIMKSHVQKSIEMIHYLPNMNYVIPAVVSHHERYDGSGYPDGIRGKDIPEEARIIGICDAYDAMTSKRTYTTIRPQAEVRAEIVRGIGTQFDPDLALIMLQMIDEDTNYEMKQNI